jgi:hypothetical protein
MKKLRRVLAGIFTLWAVCFLVALFNHGALGQAARYFAPISSGPISSRPGTCSASIELYASTDAGYALSICNSTGTGWNDVGFWGAYNAATLGTGSDIFAKVNSLVAPNRRIIIPPTTDSSCYAVTTTMTLNQAGVALDAAKACITFSGTGDAIYVTAEHVSIWAPKLLVSGAAGVRNGIHLANTAPHFRVFDGTIGPSVDDGTNQFLDGIRIDGAYYGAIYSTDVYGMSRAGFHVTNNANTPALIAISARGSSTAVKYQRYGVLVDDVVGCTNESTATAWSAVTAYTGTSSSGQCATYIGSTWRALQNGTNHTPADGSAYWTRAINTDTVTVDCTACEGNTIANVEIEGADGVKVSGHLEAIGCIPDPGATPAYSACKNLTGTLSFTTASAAVTGAGTAFTTELQVGQAIRKNTDSTHDESKYFQRICAIASDTALTLCHPYKGAGGAGVVATMTAINLYAGVNSKTYSGENCGSGQTSCAIGNLILNPVLGGSLAVPVGVYLDQGSFATIYEGGDIREPLIIDVNSAANTITAGSNTGSMLNLSITSRVCVGQTCNRLVLAPTDTTISPFAMTLPSGWTSTALVDMRDASNNIKYQVLPGGLVVPATDNTAAALLTPSPYSNGNLGLQVGAGMVFTDGPFGSPSFRTQGMWSTTLNLSGAMTTSDSTLVTNLNADMLGGVHQGGISATHVVCFKDATHFGYCSDAPAAGGTCTCN